MTTAHDNQVTTQARLAVEIIDGPSREGLWDSFRFAHDQDPYRMVGSAVEFKVRQTESQLTSDGQIVSETTYHTFTARVEGIHYCRPQFFVKHCDYRDYMVTVCPLAIDRCERSGTWSKLRYAPGNPVVLTYNAAKRNGWVSPEDLAGIIELNNQL